MERVGGELLEKYAEDFTVYGGVRGIGGVALCKVCVCNGFHGKFGLSRNVEE